MKKILWVIPKWTFPITDGARVATDRLIRNTIKDEISVDVLCLGQKNETRDEVEMISSWGIKNVYFIPRRLPESKIRKIIYYGINFLSRPFTPITFSSFSENKIRKDVNSFLIGKNYEIAVLDGLHLAGPFLNGDKLKHSSINKFVYRAHNIEKELWKKAASEKKNPILKIFLKFQCLLVEKFENAVIKTSSVVAPISQEDLEVIREIAPKQNTSLIPLGLNFSNPLPKYIEDQDKINLLFIGRLDWPPNKDGLEWFILNVWPKVILKRKNIRLTIVGSGNSSWLDKYRKIKLLNIVGFVDSIEESYQQCHFTIAPIFYGSGTRIKVLESFAMGRPLITTKMGIQGSGLSEEDYLRVEKDNEWIDLLANLELTTKVEAQLRHGQDKLIKDYDEKIVGNKFYNLLKDL